MGVINVTPDSFSDGGLFLDPGAAAEQAHRLVADGADVLDIGAESSRPGAPAVDAAEEWRRLAPVLSRLVEEQPGVQVSVDTCKPELMLRAADAGAAIINDITGGAPGEVLARLARYPDLQYIAMHMHGTPKTMQNNPLIGGVAIAAVDEFFAHAHARLAAAGFAANRIWLDPGLGFGKTDRGNIQLMRHLPTWASRYRIAAGVSRKSLIGRSLGLPVPADRDGPSKMLELGLALLGTNLIRTHDVRRLKGLLSLLDGGD